MLTKLVGRVRLIWTLNQFNMLTMGVGKVKQMFNHYNMIKLD